MDEVTDEQFEQLIGKAMDELPQEYIRNLNNVAIVWEDEPTQAQRETMRLRYNHTLFGLYEGIPRNRRGAGYTMVLPDKITLFKLPILSVSPNMEVLADQVKRTLWHEIAHHYGLDHDRIHALESKKFQA